MSSQAAGRADPLKILFVVDSRFPAMGGAESQALKLAIAMRDRGITVDFLTPQIDLDQPLEDTHLGFKITRFSYPHVKYLRTILMMGSFGRSLFAKRNDYDCTHIHITHFLTATAGIIRPLTKMPVMTKISGFFEFEGGILDMRGGARPLNWMLRKAVRNIDYVHTISQQTRVKLLDAGFNEQQITFIPNGVSVEHQPTEPPGLQKIIIGYCGRLRHVKGVHVLVEAISLLLQKGIDHSVELQIAGDGDTMGELQQQVADLGLQDSVVFLGAVSDTESFYAGLDIYVQPSFAEGLPNSVIEAMNAGRPVVASDIGGNQDLVLDGETGFLCAAGSPEEFSSKLESLIGQSSQRLAMGKAGRERIEAHFDIERVVDQLVGVYRGQ